jgi:hypothetical protein
MQIKKVSQVFNYAQRLANVWGTEAKHRAFLYLFLFISSLFNVAFSVTKIIQRRMKG